MGKADDEDYMNRTVSRINAYQKNGIFPGEKLIQSFETKKYPISTKSIEKIISHYFK